MADLKDVFAYIDAHKDDYLSLLQTMIKQPSVAAQNHGMSEMAALVEVQLSNLGFEAAQYPTGGFPVVYAERAGRSERRLSFYNHYDVQPAEPLDLWESDPWAGEIRDGRIWGRGVADNKGNLAARLAAIDAIQRVRGELPLTVKFIVEGEEEISSVHIEDFTHAHPELVAADGCIWEFGGKDFEGRQILHLGLKGICYVELRVKGANGDQHSSIASSVPNPAWRLAWALASLKGPDERVLIPGFYDKVVSPTEADIAALEAMPDESDLEKKRLGIDVFLLNEEGIERKKRDYFLPTCTISGLLSGYTGEGSKTVLPGTAMAKIDFRLVINQDPAEIFNLLREHLDAQGFDDIEVVMLGSEPPGKAPLDSPLAKVVAETYKELTGADSVLTPTSQGSGPWYQLATAFGIDACTQGAGHPATNAHAPNENIYVEDFITSIKHVVMILDRFAESKRRSRTCRSRGDASMKDVLDYIDQHRDEYIGLLQRLVRQPSVSAQGIGIAETAAMVEGLLKNRGFDASQYPTGGNPVVFGQRSGTSQKRLNFYNHYDVQPAEPLELWHSDPWAAEVRDGRIWGRGVADNKGNLAGRLAAVDAILKTRGELPLTVNFIVEGEEEIGSIHIEEFTHAHRDMIAADGCIWESGSRDDQGWQVINLGMKGICYVELRVQGVCEDQHSSRATRLPNAAWRLVWALSTLKGPDERVLIPGFYDRVRPPTEAELAALEKIPDDSAGEMERMGIDRYLLGLTGAERIERDYFQPTCTVSGLLSGYTGPGSKTVMPARAMAKVDMRLVPDQDPNEIFELLRKHLDANGFDDIEAELLGPEPPGRTSLDAPIAKVVSATWTELTGRDTILTPTAQGTGPWHQLCDALGIDGSTAGSGHLASGAHAPNENIYIDDFINHIKHAVLIMDRFATT